MTASTSDTFRAPLHARPSAVRVHPVPSQSEWAAPSLPPSRTAALGDPGANPCLSPQLASHILPVGRGAA